MAATDQVIHDPLLSLRRAIATNNLPTATTASDPTTLNDQNTTDDLAKATHLYFQTPTPHTIPLSAPTRFVSASTETQVDLRSIFFAWQKKDVAIPEYIASAQELSETLSKQPEQQADADGDRKTEEEGKNKNKAPVQNLVFVERLDLITWLEGASDESEYIRPLEGVDAGRVYVGGEGGPGGVPGGDVGGVGDGKMTGAGVGAGVGGGGGGAVGAVGGAIGGGQQHGKAVKVIDPRLRAIYDLERKMGDRNDVLRGIKPTDFSHVRKTAEIFLGRNRTRPGQYPPGTKPSGAKPIAPTAGGRKPKPSRNGDPIILLSPSASSLIRTSNAKTFLQDGIFVPPDHPTLASSDPSNILKIERPIRLNPSATTAASTTSTTTTIPKQDMRFVLVDTTANFRPEYWNRVVAVFTTGQLWQFKSYKWTSPPELFKHATGIYVGFRGDDVPREVRGWGRGVNGFTVERWDEKGGIHGAGRWRDREVVEGIWTAIEEGMRLRGWGS